MFPNKQKKLARSFKEFAVEVFVCLFVILCNAASCTPVSNLQHSHLVLPLLEAKMSNIEAVL